MARRKRKIGYPALPKAKPGVKRKIFGSIAGAVGGWKQAKAEGKGLGSGLLKGAAKGAAAGSAIGRIAGAVQGFRANAGEGLGARLRGAAAGAAGGFNNLANAGLADKIQEGYADKLDDFKNRNNEPVEEDLGETDPSMTGAVGGGVDTSAAGAGMDTGALRRGGPRRLKDRRRRRKKKGGFPDLTGDGKVTRADILKGRGVIKQNGGTVLAESNPKSTPRKVGQVRTQRTARKQVVQNEDGTYEIRKNTSRRTSRNLGDTNPNAKTNYAGKVKARKIAGRIDRRNEKIKTRKRQEGGMYKEAEVMAQKKTTGRQIDGKRRKVDVQKDKQVIWDAKEDKRSKNIYRVESKRSASKSKTVSKKRAERVAGRINKRNARRTKTVTR